MKVSCRTGALAALTTVLLAAACACGPKKTGLEAADTFSARPVPVWSAVTPQSTSVLHVKPAPLFELPLVRLLIDILKNDVQASAGVGYDELAGLLGFDPIYDASELFMTDIGGGTDETFALLLRYKKEVKLGAALMKLYALVRPTVKELATVAETKVAGRPALKAEGTPFVVVQVDPFTLALLNNGEAGAAAWLAQMSKPNDNRSKLAGALQKKAGDPFLAGRSPAVSLLVDYAALKALSGMGEKMARYMKMMGSVRRVTLLLGVEKDIIVAAEADYEDEAGAAKARNDLEALLSGDVASFPIVGEIVKAVKEKMELGHTGTLLGFKTVITEGVIDTVYVMLKLLLDVNKTNGEDKGILEQIFPQAAGGAGK